MKKIFAQSLQIGGQTITGPLDNINNLGELVNRVVQNLLMPLAGIILLFVFIWGGYEFIMSQGEPEKLKSAKAKITTGIIGFILLIVSYVIVRTLAFVFGLGGSIF